MGDAGLAMVLMVIFFILGLIIYSVYFAIVLYALSKKLNYDKPWLGFVPFAQFFLIPILAKKKWGWGFIQVIPITQIFLIILSLFEGRSDSLESIFENSGYIALVISILMILYYILIIIWSWNIFEQRKFPGFLSLILGLNILGSLYIIKEIIFNADRILKWGGSEPFMFPVLMFILGFYWIFIIFGIFYGIATWKEVPEMKSIKKEKR